MTSVYKQALNYVKPTVSIHVATANSTGSYMTVHMGLIIVAACGCVVVYCTWINNRYQVYAAIYTTVMH